MMRILNNSMVQAREVYTEVYTVIHGLTNTAYFEIFTVFCLQLSMLGF